MALGLSLVAPYLSLASPAASQGPALSQLHTGLARQSIGRDFVQDESWYCVAGLDVVDGRLIVSAEEGFRTAINRHAPVGVPGDFSVSAVLESANDDGGAIVLYGALPQGEWWQGIKRIDLGFRSGQATVAIYDGSSPNAVLGRGFPGTGLSGLVELELQKAGDEFTIKVGGSDLGRVSDPGLFGSGKLYLALNVSPGNQLAVHRLVVITGQEGDGALPWASPPEFRGAAPSGAEMRLGETLGRPAVVIEPSLFGMHIHRAATSTAWPAVPFAAWRLWDAGVAWEHIEPQKGDWRFETLDRLVALAEQQGVQVLLTLGSTPTWASARPGEAAAKYHAPGSAAEPRDMEDWRNYVRTLATRYRGRVQAYELWNEPNLRQYFSGNVDRMLALAREGYQLLKTVDPSAVVVSPAATEAQGQRWLEEYLAKGGGRFADVIGFHFYAATSAPEAMIPLVMQVKETMARHGVSDKPLWNTETGWLIERMCRSLDLRQVEPGSPASWRVLSREEAAAYVARSYVLAWAAGVDRFYWYAWDNGVMGLAEPSGRTIKPAATAYGEVARWLVGARLAGCQVDDRSTWICEITRPDGSKAWVVWNSEKEGAFDPPQSWAVYRARDLSGGAIDLPGPDGVAIGPSPVLLEGLE